MTRRALSLSAYLAWARGAFATQAPSPAPPPRPDGPVILAHANGPERGRALASLCGRLLQTRDDVRILASGDMPETGFLTPTALPRELPADCAQFTNAIAPDLVLWAGQSLRPCLLHAARKQGAHLIALDAADEIWETPAPGWLPDPAQATLALFHQIHATGQRAARRLQRLSLPPGIVHASGPLTDTGLPLDCSDALYEETSQMLGGRPVWLAARLFGQEAGDILRAHRRAVRLAHRLLLVAVPANDAELPALRRAIDAEQMRHCDWDAGGVPDENTQILLASDPDELGLWYRIAPLSFLGGSLITGQGGTDPYEAAALGTAILYGPNVGRHLASYTRLVEAGAARIVRDAETLSTAVSHLIAPDQAAGMAHAGWDVITSGAALADAVIAEIGAQLDARQAG